MRRGRKPATVIGIAMLVVLAACSSSSSVVRVDRPKGFFTRLQIPLRHRTRPTVVAAGRYVVVFSGQRTTGRTTRWMDDGAVYDTEPGVWRRMPPSPFGRAPYQVAGVWSGSDVVFVGTPCGASSFDSESAMCRGGSAEVATYSPTSNAWTGHRRLSISGPAPRPGVPLKIGGLGWADDRAVFELDDIEGAEALVVEPTSGRARSIAVAGTAVQCVLDGHLFGFGASATVTVLPAQGRPPRSPLRTVEWASGSAWTEVAGVPDVGPGLVYEDRVTCQAGAAAYVPVYPPPVGIGPGQWWFSPRDRTWQRVADLPAQGFPHQPSIAQNGATRIVQLATNWWELAPGAAAWTRTAAPGLTYVNSTGPVTTATVPRIELLDSWFLLVPSEPPARDVLALGLVRRAGRT
ncbi:MAG: hypothetical protein ACXVJ7_12715 [Acidimicrobiia bacterium]